jgi:hypothetical protein
VGIRFSIYLLILVQGGSTGKVRSNLDQSVVLSNYTVS